MSLERTCDIFFATPDSKYLDKIATSERLKQNLTKLIKIATIAEGARGKDERAHVFEIDSTLRPRFGVESMGRTNLGCSLSSALSYMGKNGIAQVPT